MKKLAACVAAVAVFGGAIIAAGSDEEIKACVADAAMAVSDKNMDALLDKCTKSARKEVRARMAMTFAAGDTNLELLGCEVASSSRSVAKVVARYSLGGRTIVSDITLKKEQGYWKISEERTVQESGMFPVCTAHRGAFYAAGMFSR